MESQYKFYAFISYNSSDEKWAKWLQRKIEYYRLPAIARKSKSDSPLPRKLKPVFFAKTDIQLGPLRDELRQELEQSRYLIVVCSPRSAKSDWVGREIADFIALGRADRIILLIVDGIPYSDDPNTECIHPVLKRELPELLGAHIHEKGTENRYIKRERAFIRVLSQMVEIEFDKLWQRHRRRRIQQAVLSALFALCIVCAMVGIWKSNQPFNVQMSLQEVTPPNANLGFPYQGGEVTIVCDSPKTLSGKVKSLSDKVTFEDIPGHYLNTEVKVLFRLWGYKDLDTVMTLTPEMTLPVARRDDSFGKVHGYVLQGTTRHGVEGVQVEVASQLTKTDKDGFFVLQIPLEKQRVSYPARLSRNGKQLPGQLVYPALQDDENRINTLYFE